MPGSASAAATIALAPGPCGRDAPAASVAATAAPADAVAAGRSLLARVDVLIELRLQPVRVDLHRRLREVPALPGLRRLDRRAPGGGDSDQRDEENERGAHENLRGRRAGQCGASSERIRASSSPFCSSRNPLSTATTLPARSTRYELG